MPEEKEVSVNEKRIRSLTQIYYSRPEIQKAIFNFSKDREISPRYFEGFGKRPDSLQYPSEVFQLVKKGATSFHCSEEYWSDVLKIESGMSPEQANKLRIGWDLLIDIDCKWFEYSKIAAKSIIKVLQNHGIKNIGLKYSGSKGFHILVPWKAFPKEIAGKKTKYLFPELPKTVVSYIRFKAEKEIANFLPKDFFSRINSTNVRQGIKCQNCSEIADELIFAAYECPQCGRFEQKKVQGNFEKKLKCPDCRGDLIYQEDKSKKIFVCNKCNISSQNSPENFKQGTVEVDLFEIMGLDLVLVSSRHLFRMPYSLHEKTSLASTVIPLDELEDFDMKDAHNMKIKVLDFMPNSKENEARELVVQALDWGKEHELKRGETRQIIKDKFSKNKKSELVNVQENQFPPCIRKILDGVQDGKKRALFILINFFRSVGFSTEDVQKKIKIWNEKNKPPLKEAYIKPQLEWSYKKTPLMPPNCKEFYQGIGVCSPDSLCQKIKNPVNYTSRKNFAVNAPKKKIKRKARKQSNKDNFKKKK